MVEDFLEWREDFLECPRQVLIHISQGKEEAAIVLRPEDSDQLRKRKVLVIFRDIKRLN